MTIEQSGIIDLIAIPPCEGVAWLIISDHLEWGQDDHNHMFRLQEKVNEYLSFIEGGTLLDARPDLNDKRLIIKVISLHKLNAEGADFVERMKDVLAKAGYVFVFETKN